MAMPACKPCLLALFSVVMALPAAAQVLGPQPSIHEGKDPVTQTDFVLLTISAEPGAGSAPDARLASLTIQCSQAGSHRVIDVFLDPRGTQSEAYRPPEPATETIPYPISKIAMTFDGYKPHLWQWEQLPAGEFHYKNPGGMTSNLEGPLFLMHWMFATRITRFQITKTSSLLEFHDSNLVDAARKTPLCAP